jgi:hypothetical protein
MSDTATTEVSTDSEQRVKSKRGRRILVFILILLLLLMCGAAFLLYRIITPSGGAAGPSENNGIIWVRSIYGIDNTVPGSLERAQAAVSGDDGTIWVVDSIHKALLRFTPDGRFTGRVTGPQDAPLTIPGRFAIDSDGLFYVVETSQDAVRILNSSNEDVGSFRIPEPVSVAVSGDRIVVGSLAGFAILEKTGEPIKVFGTRGSGDGQFDYVHGVAIAEDGTIFVMDSWNNRLSAYDATGKQLWIKRTGKPNNNAQTNGGPLTVPDAEDQAVTDEQAMQLPLGITIDGAGRIVVVDMFSGTLNVFSPKDGSFIASFGETGPEDGEFFYPVSVSYDEGRDWFTVADALNNRVQIIRLPNSAGDGGAQAAARRALVGPLRACLFPFLLLILILILWLVARALRKRRSDEPVPSELDAEELPVVDMITPDETILDVSEQEVK